MGNVEFDGDSDRSNVRDPELGLKNAAVRPLTLKSFPYVVKVKISCCSGIVWTRSYAVG